MKSNKIIFSALALAVLTSFTACGTADRSNYTRNQYADLSALPLRMLFLPKKQTAAMIPKKTAARRNPLLTAAVLPKKLLLL